MSAHNDYFPDRAGDRIIWLNNFRNKIGNYSAALGYAAGLERVLADRHLHERWLAAFSSLRSLVKAPYDDATPMERSHYHVAHLVMHSHAATATQR
jgi:hypothetical protein